MILLLILYLVLFKGVAPLVCLWSVNVITILLLYFSIFFLDLCITFDLLTVQVGQPNHSWASWIALIFVWLNTALIAFWCTVLFDFFFFGGNLKMFITLDKMGWCIETKKNRLKKLIVYIWKQCELNLLSCDVR